MIEAIVATLLVSLLSLSGAIFLMKKEIISARYGRLMISIAAGVMLATAVLGLLPEAVEMFHGHDAYWVFLLGICFFFVMERMVHWYHHHQHNPEHQSGHLKAAEVRPTAYLILAGDSLHNFFDGVAIATAFNISFEVGVATTLAIILHEIPQELADFIALTHSGLKVKKALLFNLLTALTAVLGAVVGWYFLHALEGSLPYLVAFNAGMFIYIATSDLIPALHEDFKKNRKWLQTFAFLLGVVLMGLLLNSIGHSHEHEEDDHAEESRLEHVEIKRVEGESTLVAE